MMRTRCATILMLFLVTASCPWLHGTKVHTRFGTIRGLWSRSTRGRLVAYYLGIPYAEPPVGDLRFRSPRPWNHTWNSTFNAIQDGPMCIQQVSDTVIGSEDCLNLNIFVPIITDKRELTDKLPVMVYIHGGKYLYGSNNVTQISPEYMMDQNIIMVTPNYRLNVMGFFTTENKIAPGNYGLKDIVMALRWVQENIHVFKGDPNSVTLWGHSTGASAVHTLAYSKKTEGLFHRCILQSGSVFVPVAVNIEGWMRDISFKVARMLNCLPRQENAANSTEDLEQDEQDYSFEMFDEQDDQQILECMKAADAKAIAKLLNHFTDRTKYSNYPFGPVIEDDSEDAIITRHPLITLKKRLFRDIPIIVGVVRDELIGEVRRILNETDPLGFVEKHLPTLIDYHQIMNNKSALVNAVKEFYFDSNDTETFQKGLVHAFSDLLVVYWVYEILERQSGVMNSSVYFYYFTYKGTFTATFNLGTPIHYGIAHMDDLNYLIPLLNKKYAGYMLHNTESDITIINIMTEMWANFAATGVPRAWRVPAWPDYKVAHEFLQIGKEKQPDIFVANNFLPERMEFCKYTEENLTILESYLEYDEETEVPVLAKEQTYSRGWGISDNSIIPLLTLLVLVFRR